MKIKNIVTKLLISFILASCSPAAKVAPTETAVPTSTFMPIPPTPTITPTLDPMINAPEHATEYDSVRKTYIWVEGNNIYYYDNERQIFSWDADDGYTYFYREIQLANGEINAAWFRPLIENYFAYDYEDVSAIPMDVWVKYGTPGSESIIKMTHRDVTSAGDLGKTPDRMNKYLIAMFGIVDPSDLMKSGKDFTHAFTFNGKELIADFSNKGGFQITFVSEEELKPLVAENKAVRSSGNLANGFIYLSYDKVVNRKVQVRVASSLPLDELLDKSPSGDPQYEFRYMIFLALMNILVADDGTDLNDFAALTPASLVAADSARPRPGDGLPDLQIEYK